MNAQETIIQFLRDEMLIGPDETPGIDDSLLATGILDSFSVMALLDQLERTLNIKISRKDLKRADVETLRSLENICRAVKGGA